MAIAAAAAAMLCAALNRLPLHRSRPAIRYSTLLGISTIWVAPRPLRSMASAKVLMPLGVRAEVLMDRAPSPAPVLDSGQHMAVLHRSSRRTRAEPAMAERPTAGKKPVATKKLAAANKPAA